MRDVTGNDLDQRASLKLLANENSASQVLMEKVRRMSLALESLGSSEANIRLAAALSSNTGICHPTTVLLNETGLTRTTLVRRLDRFISMGFVVREVRLRRFGYRPTPKGLRFIEARLFEIAQVVRGQRCGFSEDLRQDALALGFAVQPNARTIGFPPMSPC